MARADSTQRWQTGERPQMDVLELLPGNPPAPTTERWQRAREHKRQLRPFTAASLDPGPGALRRLGKGQVGCLLSAGPEQARVRPCANPAPGTSFGFAGCFAEVEAAASYVPGVLVLRLDRHRVEPIAARTLRLFRWEPEDRQFQMVEPSGVGRSGDYVWAHITLPGRYAAIGINTDPLVLRALRFTAAATGLAEASYEAATRLPESAGYDLFPRETRRALAYLKRRVAHEGGGATGSRDQRANTSSGTGAGARGTGVPLLHRTGLPECQLIEAGCDDSAWDLLGPVGTSGCIRQVVVDPTHPDRLFAAASNGGLWRLQSVRDYPIEWWEPLTDHTESLATTAVAVAPSRGSVLYVANGLGQVLRNDVGGHPWLWQPAGDRRLGAIRKLLVHPADPDTVFAATTTGFHMIEIGATDWVRLCGGDVTDAAMDPADPSVVYLGVRGAAPDGAGVYKLRGPDWEPHLVLPWQAAGGDGGRSTAIKVALGRRGGDSTRTVVAKLGARVLVNRHGGRGPDVPGGGAWEPRGQVGGDGYGDWCHVVAVDPFDDDVLLAGAQELHRSTDGGQTWARVVTAGDAYEDHQSIAFDPARRGVVYLSNAWGVWRSADGGRSWHSLARARDLSERYHPGRTQTADGRPHFGYDGQRAPASARHRTGAAPSAPAPQATAGGQDWELVDAGVDPERQERFNVLAMDGLARRRHAELAPGDRFYSMARRWSPSIPAHLAPSCVAADPRWNGSVLLVGTRRGDIVRITNAGGHRLDELEDELGGRTDAQTTWSRETGIDVPGTAGLAGRLREPIVAVAFAAQPGTRPSGLAYAVSRSGWVFRTCDAGAGVPWKRLGRWDTGGDAVRHLAVNPVHPERFYLVSSSTVVTCSYGGGDLRVQAAAGQAPNALPVSDNHSILTRPQSGRFLFLGADVGVFVSPDEGQHWYTFDDGLPDTEVLQTFLVGGYLYAVTSGWGLWRRPVQLG